MYAASGTPSAVRRNNSLDCFASCALGILHFTFKVEIFGNSEYFRNEFVVQDYPSGIH